jgi:hypothetical protein
MWVHGNPCLHGIKKIWIYILLIIYISENQSKSKIYLSRCWYAIPQEEDKKFKEFATKHFSEAARECSEFLRHKTFMINPSIVQENGLTVNKCIQYPGEFVITKCAGYHSGFNYGI